jgi:hypothetical protein
MYLTTIPHQLIFICMDKRFLNKVVDQIVSETKIDYDRKVIGTPLHPIPFHYPSPTFIRPTSPLIFSRHCKNVYGLNEQEIKYVWKEYKKIINDEIKSNGI